MGARHGIGSYVSFFFLIKYRVYFLGKTFIDCIGRVLCFYLYISLISPLPNTKASGTRFQTIPTGMYSCADDKWPEIISAGHKQCGYMHPWGTASVGLQRSNGMVYTQISQGFYIEAHSQGHHHHWFPVPWRPTKSIILQKRSHPRVTYFCPIFTCFLKLDKSSICSMLTYLRDRVGSQTTRARGR
jgi:hypothetical protein